MYALRILTQAVGVRKERFNFACKVHTSDDQTSFLLDHAFYEEAGGLPQGTHNELELVDEWIWKDYPELVIHFRTSTLNGKRFVCFPKRIADITEVFKVFLIWSLGTTFTIKTGEDFNPLYKGDPEVFAREMEKIHGILPVFIRFSFKL